MMLQLLIIITDYNTEQAGQKTRHMVRDEEALREAGAS